MQVKKEIKKKGAKKKKKKKKKKRKKKKINFVFTIIMNTQLIFRFIITSHPTA